MPDQIKISWRRISSQDLDADGNKEFLRLHTGIYLWLWPGPANFQVVYVGKTIKSFWIRLQAELAQTSGGIGTWFDLSPKTDLVAKAIECAKTNNPLSSFKEWVHVPALDQKCRDLFLDEDAALRRTRYLKNLSFIFGEIQDAQGRSIRKIEALIADLFLKRYYGSVEAIMRDKKNREVLLGKTDTRDEDMVLEDDEKLFKLLEY